MQPIALECIVYFHWGRLLQQTCMLLTTTLSPRVITCNWVQTHFFFTFISSFISLFTGWAGFRLLLFSGGLPSFSISAMFSLWYFCQYLRWGRERRGWERQRQLFTVARRRMSCSFSAARVTLAMPPRACGARLSQPSSARILHGPCTSGEPPQWVKGEVEWGEKTRQGEGRPLKHYMTRWWSEVGYFFSLSHGVQSQQSHPLSAAPSWWQSASSKQVPTQSHTVLQGSLQPAAAVAHNLISLFISYRLHCFGHPTPLTKHKSSRELPVRLAVWTFFCQSARESALLKDASVDQWMFPSTCISSERRKLCVRRSRSQWRVRRFNTHSRPKETFRCVDFVMTEPSWLSFQLAFSELRLLSQFVPSGCSLRHQLVWRKYGCLPFLC